MTTDVTDTIEKFRGKILKESDEYAQLPTDDLSAAEAVHIFSVVSLFLKLASTVPECIKQSYLV